LTAKYSNVIISIESGEVRFTTMPALITYSVLISKLGYKRKRDNLTNIYINSLSKYIINKEDFRMKNLKKVLALLVVFTMVLSTVAFAAPVKFADVKENATYAEAVITLSSLGLLKGDDKGNFNPDKTITRAEFSAVVCRMLGLGDPGKTATIFTDVPADHWASGYVQLANQMGIVKGYGDGTFGPDDEVTYEQAIKMIVVALGYEPKAASLGGYPTGYMVVAAQKKITNKADGKVGEPAKRSVVAQLAFNALDTNLMEQVGFGTQISYEEVDKTLLEDKLGIEKLEGTVVKNAFTALTSKNTSLDMDEVVIEYDYYDEYDGEWETDTDTFNVGDTNAAELLGYRVTFYVKDRGERDATILSINIDTKTNNVLVVDADDMEFVDLGNDTFEYWVDKDKDDEPEEEDLNSKLIAIYNGVYYDQNDGKSGTIEKLEEILMPTSGHITFLDNDDDDVYDIAFVTKYSNYIVDEIDEQKYRVETTSGDTFVFDPDDDDKKFAIYDEDGYEMDFDDIQEGDVLSIVMDGKNFNDSSVLKVYVVRKVVEGTVTEINVDEDGETEYTIEGEVYKLAEEFDGRIDLDDTGKFYLSIDGKIVDVDTKAGQGSSNYAMLLKVGAPSGGIDDTYQAKLLTADGKKVVYDIGDKITLNGVKLTKDETVNFITKGITLTDAYDEPIDFEALNKADGTAENAQLITYKVNSSGEITHINIALSAKLNSKIYSKYEEDEFSLDVEKQEYEFDEDDNELGKYELDEKVVIFDCSKGDIDDWTVKSLKSLKDEAKYLVDIYDDAEKDYPGAIVIWDSSVTLSDTSLAIVDKITTARNDEGDQVYKIYAYVDGELVTLIDEENESVGLKRGDVFQFSADENNVITDFDIVLALGGKLSEKARVINDDKDLDDVYIVYGSVYERKTDSVTVGVTEGSADKFKKRSDTNVYLVNFRKDRVTVESFSEIDKDDWALIRVYDDDLKEVIIFRD